MKNREKNKKPHGIPDNMAGAQNNQIIPPQKSCNEKDDILV